MKKSIKKFIALLFLFQIAIFCEQSINCTDTLRVMTYNIRRKGRESKPEHAWKVRLPLMHETIKKLEPDIMGLQEATKKQIKDLQRACPNLSHCGEGRGSSWWGLGRNEYTPIFYNKNKFILLNHDTFLINKTKSTLGWMLWDAKKTGWLPRICTVAQFKATETDQEFYVYNTHLDHMFPKAQEKGSKAVMRHIAKHSQGLPVILMGDFNTEFKGNVKKAFENFQHTKEIAQHSFGPNITSMGWDNEKQQIIDHILINKGSDMSVKTHAVIPYEGTMYPSDHRPVVVELSIN